MFIHNSQVGETGNVDSSLKRIFGYADAQGSSKAEQIILPPRQFLVFIYSG